MRAKRQQVRVPQPGGTTAMPWGETSTSPPERSPHPTDLSAFMEGVRRKRLELGMSQADLARQVGISVPYLCQLERGQKGNPTVQVVLNLAQVLHLPHPHDMRSEDEPLPESPVMGWLRTEIERAIANQGPEGRRRLMAYPPGMRVAWTIKAVLRLTGMGRVALAEHLQLTPRGLRDILERNANPSPNVVQRLCSLTGIPCDFFYKGRLDWNGTSTAPTAELEDLRSLVESLLYAGIAPGTIRTALRKLQASPR